MYRIWCSSLVVMAISGCQSGPSWSSIEEKIHSDFPGVTQITPEELEVKLKGSDVLKPLLLDVREPEEYAVSHLPNAIRVQPGSDASEVLASIPKDASIVAYCSVGYRSSQLAKRLMEEGFVNVVNLEGSIFEWANNGYSVERNGNVVEQVHPYNAEWGELLDSKLHAYEASDP